MSIGLYMYRYHLFHMDGGGFSDNDRLYDIDKTDQYISDTILSGDTYIIASDLECLIYNLQHGYNDSSVCRLLFGGVVLLEIMTFCLLGHVYNF